VVCVTVACNERNCHAFMLGYYIKMVACNVFEPFNVRVTCLRYSVAIMVCAFSLLFQKHGPRMKCSACKIIAHTSCISILMERTKFSCKATFRDVGVRQYREQTCIHHHWVHRRSQKGKCKQCGKVSSENLSSSRPRVWKWLSSGMLLPLDPKVAGSNAAKAIDF
jgi:diacylglycerol kinase (ATP)